MKKNIQRLSAVVLSAILLAGSLTACSGDTDTTDTTAADTTAAITEKITDPATEKDTDPVTEAVTDPVTDPVTDAATEAVTEPETEAETECHLLFEDDFDGAAVDTAKWNVGTAKDQPAKEKDVTLWDASMVALDGEGHLLLKTEWDATEKVARSGAVTTKGLFEAGYGYYEASIKFPLVYARNNLFTVTAGNTTIDVIKSINGIQAATSYEQNLKSGGTLRTLDAMRTVFINIYDGRFHAFGVLRSAEGYTFYVDGVESGSIPASEIDATNASGFLSLFWEAPRAAGAGRAESQYDTTTEMIVDYVRVYSSLPETLGKAEPSANAELVFNDEFDGTELDGSKWERCPEWDRQGKSHWDNDLSYLDGEGNLILGMDWNETTQLVDCGAVRTAGRFAYGYGYYEISARFTEHHGAWGAFWVMAGNVGSEANGAADGVEIDVIETIDNQNGIYNHNVHWDGYGDAHKAAPPVLLSRFDIYDGEYHTFGVLRSDKGYFFYIDGKLSGIVPAYQADPCPDDGYLKLTCEAAEWSGAGSEECIADMPAEMVVDYVRIYSSMPELNP